MDFGKYILHRGLHNDKIPENSLPAFKAAVNLGYSAELDVRLTKDCKLVVFHDSNLQRMCGADVNVAELTYEQLKAFKLKNSDERIPLLKDVLKLVNGRVPLLIELKGKSFCGVMQKRLMALLKNYNGEYAVQSFDPFDMLWFRVYQPKVPRGQLISTFKDKKFLLRKIAAQPIVWRLISKPNFIGADLRSISLQQLFASIDAGADFITWTANTPKLLEVAEQFSKTVIVDSSALESDG